MPTLQDLRDDLRDAIGYQDDTEFPNEQADRVLNRAYWQVINQIPLKEKEKLITFPLVADHNSYEIPSDYESIVSVFLVDDLTHAQTQILRMSPEAQEERVLESSAETGKPVYYYRFNDCIKFSPIPDDAYTVKLLYYKNLADLVTGEFPLEKIYYDVILFGACYRQLFTLKQTDLAKDYKNQQTALLVSLQPTNEKEKADSRYAGVECILPDYP